MPMKYNYKINFNSDKILKDCGLEEKGRVQQYVTSEVMRITDPYVPFDEANKYGNPGQLKDSADIENGTDIVYSTPYARKMYYHPEYNFQGAPIRGAYWADRAMANGGLEQIKNGIKKVIGK